MVEGVTVFPLDALPQSVGRQADSGRSPAGINTARGQTEHPVWLDPVTTNSG